MLKCDQKLYEIASKLDLDALFSAPETLETLKMLHRASEPLGPNHRRMINLQ